MTLPLEEIKKIVGEGNLCTEPLSRHTSFRIGGECTVASPVTPLAAAELVEFAGEKGIPYFVLGNGTNVLCSDDGWDGLVIKTKGLSAIEVTGDSIVAGGGAILSRVAGAAAAAGLSGLEFAHGIPGTVGGAVAMNAGAYGGEMSDCVVKTVCLIPNVGIVTLSGGEHGFSYRRSVITETAGAMVLECEMKLGRGNRDEIEEKMRELAARRRASQPLELPSAGSVFKRPEGRFVGAMVQECGLKGRTVGGAQVSPKHAGFIVNVGSATAADVLELIEIIRAEVFGRFGVQLECEIRPLGLGREEI
ncbi:MAG: UDP-N-acetylmuramate dehydrogenase [Clostridia bacterium]|nr:UDP-N-acetylmuramate dehydrogenase [Clostridia bacterium]